MDFRLLGPVEATVGPTTVELRGRKQRALLARLLLDPGRVVAVDQLVDDLWGEDAPDSAVKMVQIYVSQLRKVLPGEVLRTSVPGYVADVSPTDVDVVRFTDLRARGASALASGNLRAAARLFGDALRLWRGPALSGLTEPFADAELLHLEERRVECLEDRAEAELGLGRHGELVAELSALAARHPLRERPHRQLMLALYRSGRHAEALDVYRAFRRRLDEELGMEPPAALRELEERMLRQDPELAGPERPAPATIRVLAPPPPSPPRAPAPPAAAGRPSEIRYARSGDTSIAYQVVGEGEPTLLFVPGFVSHVEVLWEDPATARFFDRLASFARVVLHDKREQGLSDRFGRPPSLQDSAADVIAVMDAVGCDRAAVLGISEGGPLAITVAATYPERVSALVVYGTWPRLMNGDGYEHGIPPRLMDAWHGEILRDWGGALSLELFAPTLAGDQRFATWWARLLRAGTSPHGAARLFDLHRTADVRPLLARVDAPTLVLHREDDLLTPVAGGRYLAEHIGDARFVALSGADHLWMAGDQDELLDEVEEFLTGNRAAREPERVLQTVLFVDIVGSTRHAGDVGDRRWRDLLAAYDARVARQLERHDGRLVKQLGDGTLAAFDQPARAIRCARAIRRDVAELGLELRAGLHTGECEVRDGDLAGMAVHIGARVGAGAEPGELLVSSTVKDLVAGSELRFTERGTRELRGVPGTWTLFAVEDDG